MLQVPIICCDQNIEKAVLMDRQRFGFNTRMSIELDVFILQFENRGRSEPGEELGTVPVVGAHSVVVGRPTLGLCR